MNNLFGVTIVHCLENLLDNLSSYLLLKVFLFNKRIIKLPAFEEFRDHVDALRVLIDLIKFNDVWVVQIPQYVYLISKTFQVRLITALLPYDFHCSNFLSDLVNYFFHLSVSTLAYDSQHFIVLTDLPFLLTDEHLSIYIDVNPRERPLF